MTDRWASAHPRLRGLTTPYLAGPTSHQDEPWLEERVP
jgi:hypothetical protein